MSFVRIGTVETASAYYCDVTDQFLCLDPRGAAILEAYELGIPREDVQAALGQRAAAVDDPEFEFLWNTLTRAAEVQCTESVETATPATRTQAMLSDPGACSRHLDVDCGPLVVRVSATPAAAQAIFPILSRYYRVCRADPVAPVENRIFLRDRPDGLIAKSVTSPCYAVEDSSAPADSLFVAMSKDLTELACNYDNTLCVLHAATLCRDGKTLILSNPSGSGKTTLAWLLVTAGFELVHDDVLPVRLDGTIESLKTPSTIKEGSWDVLSKAGLALPQDCFERFQTRAKFRPIEGSGSCRSSDDRYIVFPTYSPGQPATLESLSPIETFSRIIREECVIRDRSIDRLQRIFQWITSSRGAVLGYSDKDEAVALLGGWMRAER